jgi:phospholipid/cholesterol/gamma-HCH transport system substrate-binding protein
VYIKTETKVGVFVLAALAVLCYMTFYLGLFRFNLSDYKPYTMFFDDATGLAAKGDVKIAGVKVGWIENFGLDQQGRGVRVTVMIKENCILHDDARAIIRQDGVLGSKFLEIVPGTYEQKVLPRGAVFSHRGQTPASLEEVMSKIKTVADALCGEDGSDIRGFLTNMNQASDRIARFAESLERAFVDNEGNIDSMLKNIASVAQEMKTSMPKLSHDVQAVMDRLNAEVLPSIKKDIDKVTAVFDEDVGGLARDLKQTNKTVDGAAQQVGDSFKTVSSIAQKVNEGTGFIGKLVNDDQAYNDIKYAARGLKNYFAAVNNMGLVFDVNSAQMMRACDGYSHRDAKSFYNTRLFFNEDTFIQIGAASSMKGYPKRTYESCKWYNQDGQKLSQDNCQLILTTDGTIQRASKESCVSVTRNSWAINLQCGKCFKDICVRAGLIEGMGGVAVDINMPFSNNDFRWIMSMEAYDFFGQNHFLEDRRPHLSWVNRVFFFRNLYTVFGADDFISKSNASPFFGFGLRFGDDDLKYLLSRLSGFTGMSGN